MKGHWNAGSNYKGSNFRIHSHVQPPDSCRGSCLPDRRATAVLNGWRETTVDIDLSFVPDRDDLYRSIPEIKEKLHINVEMAAPSDFIPALPGWEDRSKFICREGKVDFFHYDIYSQALSKIERGHEKDIRDVQSMIKDGLIEPQKLLELFEAIEPFLYKYPAIDPKSFSDAVREIV